METNTATTLPTVRYCVYTAGLTERLGIFRLPTGLFTMDGPIFERRSSLAGNPLSGVNTVRIYTAEVNGSMRAASTTELFRVFSMYSQALQQIYSIATNCDRLIQL
jgi:hypothetical protein